MKSIIIKTVGIMLMAVVLMAAASKTGTRETAGSQATITPMLLAAAR